MPLLKSRSPRVPSNLTRTPFRLLSATATIVFISSAVGFINPTTRNLRPAVVFAQALVVPHGNLVDTRVFESDSSQPLTSTVQDPYVKREPPYAKWGHIAVQQAKNHYPQAKVVDYLHVGRTDTSAATAQEVFKLWLKSPTREFGVLVTCTLNKQTNQLISIQLREL